jgi:hypothetical protein
VAGIVKWKVIEGRIPRRGSGRSRQSRLRVDAHDLRQHLLAYIVKGITGGNAKRLKRCLRIDERRGCTSGRICLERVSGRLEIELLIGAAGKITSNDRNVLDESLEADARSAAVDEPAAVDKYVLDDLAEFTDETNAVSNRVREFAVDDADVTTEMTDLDAVVLMRRIWDRRRTWSRRRRPAPGRRRVRWRRAC